MAEVSYFICDKCGKKINRDERGSVWNARGPRSGVHSGKYFRYDLCGMCFDDIVELMERFGLDPKNCDDENSIWF